MSQNITEDGCHGDKRQGRATQAQIQCAARSLLQEQGRYRDKAVEIHLLRLYRRLQAIQACVFIVALQ